MAFGLSIETSYSQGVPGDGGEQQPQINNPGTQNIGATGNVRTGGGDPDITQRQVDIEIAEDTRNQGFVGATTSAVTAAGNDANGEFSTGHRYVGAVSEQSGSPLSGDASFGGGLNTRSPIIGSANATGGGGGFGGANGVVTTITRRSVRARLRPSFYAPRPSDQTVSNRFQSRFVRQPGSNLVGNGYSVNVQNRTAFVTGTVNSQMDSERIVRQLRLEPGVYKVVNQLSISGQQPVSAPSNQGFGSGFSQPTVQPQAFPPVVQPQIIQQQSFQQPVAVEQPVPQIGFRKIN